MAGGPSSATAAGELRLELAAVDAFVAEFDRAFDGRLAGFLNYSRVVALATFHRLVGLLALGEQEHVGIVSGSEAEPELAFVRAARTTVLSFDRDPAWDLERSWLGEPAAGFSLTLCNQVLEHVFDPHLAFANLVHQTRPGGHLYVSIPAVNCVHGEPHYYSAGFHPRFLRRLGERHGLELLHVGHWGSYKYLVAAVSGAWLTDRQLRAGAGPAFLHPQLIARDGRVADRHITDCWALYRRPAPAAAVQDGRPQVAPP